MNVAMWLFNFVSLMSDVFCVSSVQILLLYFCNKTWNLASITIVSLFFSLLLLCLFWGFVFPCKIKTFCNCYCCRLSIVCFLFLWRNALGCLLMETALKSAHFFLWNDRFHNINSYNPWSLKVFPSVFFIILFLNFLKVSIVEILNKGSISWILCWTKCEIMKLDLYFSPWQKN